MTQPLSSKSWKQCLNPYPQSPRNIDSTPTLGVLQTMTQPLPSESYKQWLNPYPQSPRNNGLSLTLRVCLLAGAHFSWFIYSTSSTTIWLGLKYINASCISPLKTRSYKWYRRVQPYQCYMICYLHLYLWCGSHTPAPSFSCEPSAVLSTCKTTQPYSGHYEMYLWFCFLRLVTDISSSVHIVTQLCWQSSVCKIYFFLSFFFFFFFGGYFNNIFIMLLVNTSGK